ncbi:MAG TPA: hypothetical protein DIU29_02240 [Candidatus Jacksonbacteria bacterium]|nr:hypothetical protein [Candidatus Jacksonbacteria bacterium]HCR15026.1 hypothetical protein [Candidatus Jacksonbacteria bacterium]
MTRFYAMQTNNNSIDSIVTQQVIGIIGEIAAGKTTVTKYLEEKYGAVTYRFSDMLRDILARLYLENRRHNMQTLSTCLRQNFGDDLMSKVIVADVKKSKERIIITEGIRRPSDAVYLRELPNFHIISVTSDIKLRHQRLGERRENPDDSTTTWEQFVRQNNQESEQKIKEIASQADFTLDNNGSLENLYRELDKIICGLIGV